MGRRIVLHLLTGRKLILARRRWRRVTDPVPPAERRQCLIRHLRTCGHQILMDPHEIPLAPVEKLQDLLPVGFGLFGSVQLRQGSRVGAHDFAYRYARDSQHSCDFPFAHSLRVQFQNRRALRLAQHAASSPVGFLRRCGGVGFECARSDAARLSIAGYPTRWQRRPPGAVARGSQSPPPSPDRATVRHQSRRQLSPAPAAAFGKTVPDHREGVCGLRTNLCATRHTVGRLPAYRSGAERRSLPSAGNPPGFGGPPAPETSTPPAPGSCPRAPAAEWLPAELPPAPVAAIPSSRCGRTGLPTHPARSRSAAPTPPAASPPRAQFRVGINAANGPAARPRLRSSAIPLLLLCPGPVAPTPESACSHR